MNDKRKLMLLALSAVLLSLALMICLLNTESALGQQGWPRGEMNGEPAKEDDARDVVGAWDGKDSTGDDEFETLPEGDQVLVNSWYNGTGTNWVIEKDDLVRRGNQSIDMKGRDIQVYGHLELVNTTLVNVGTIQVHQEGVLILREDGGNPWSRSVTVNVAKVLVQGSLRIEGQENRKIQMNGLREGVVLHNGEAMENLSLTTAPGQGNISLGLVLKNEKFTVQNCEFAAAGFSVLLELQGASATITNNSFRGGDREGTTGILLQNAGIDTRIEENSFTQLKNHAILGIDSGASIKKNEFERMNYGAEGDGEHENYIVYMLGAEPQNANTFVSDNKWTNNGATGKLFMQCYRITVTVLDADSGEPVEGAWVKLNGYWADTSRNGGLTNQSGKIVLDCCEYYAYGSTTGTNQRHGTNEGKDPYSFIASEYEASAEKEFSAVGEDGELTINLKRNNYDFHITDLKVTTPFSGDRILVGEKTNISLTVKNTGHQDAGGVSVGFSLLTAGRGLVKLDSTEVDVPAGGEAKTFLLYCPGEALAGRQVTFSVIVDDAHQFAEFDEDNNLDGKPEQLMEALPGIIINEPTQDEELREFKALNGIVLDAGGEPAHAVEVRLDGGDWQEVELEDGNWIFTNWEKRTNGPLAMEFRALSPVRYKDSGDHVPGPVASRNFTLAIPADMSFSQGTEFTLWGNASDDFTIRGKALAHVDNDIQEIRVVLDKENLTLANFDPWDGSWEFTWESINTLPRDGLYDLTVVAVDQAGVVTELSQDFKVFVDDPATDPELIITTEQGQALTSEGITVVGYVLDDYQVTAVQWSMNGISWENVAAFEPGQANSSWSIVIDEEEFDFSGPGWEDHIFFKTGDWQEWSETKLFTVRDPSAGTDLYLAFQECSLSTRNPVVGQSFQVRYIIHVNGPVPEEEITVMLEIANVSVGPVPVFLNGRRDLEVTSTIKPREEHLGKKDLKITLVLQDELETGNNVVVFSTEVVVEEGDPGPDPEPFPWDFLFPILGVVAIITIGLGVYLAKRN